MSDTPFMPLWVSDFVGDTLDLEAKEIGAYMLILMTMWGRDGYLPNDSKKLQRVARCGRDWPRVWASIQHYFTVEGDKITQNRLLKELQKVASKRQVNAQNGSRGGHAKALKNKDVPLANASHSPKQPEPYPEPEENTPLPPKGDDGFELFWSKVPRKVAKGGARKAFKAALKKASLDQITRGMEGYAKSVKGKDPQYIAHPSTWLNQERWADEVKSADTRTWRDKPESEWTNKDRTEWAKAML